MSGVTVGLITVGAVVAAAVICLVILYVVMLQKRSTETRTIEADGATRLDARMNIRFGDLEVTGGSSGLADAEISSNVRGFEPTVKYSASENKGRLEIIGNPPNWVAGWLGKTLYSLRFSDSTPLNLSVSLGKGNGALKLGRLSLESLEVTATAGRVDVDTSGEMELLETVNVSGNAGDVGVLMGGRYPAMRKLDVSNSAGDTQVSLLGTWTRDLDCRITSTAGAIRVELPDEVGVSVNAVSSAGEIWAKGMTQVTEGVWANRAYGNSDVKLKLTIRNTAGAIRLVPAGPGTSQAGPGT